MLCQNCGENEANFKYTEITNGVKKEFSLCDECAQKLGVGKIDFNIPINFSSFFGDFLNEYENTGFIPMLTKSNELKCDVCNMTYDEFMNTGKFGCGHCYDVFSGKIDPVLKRLHGETKYLGRKAKIDTKNDIKDIKEEPKQEQSKLDILKEKLKEAIKLENYEEAAKLRDEIKKYENK